MKVARVNGRSVVFMDSALGLGGTGALPSLSELPDVDVTGLADGDVLVWDDGTSTWVPGTSIGTGFLEVTGGGKGTVSDLSTLGSTETVDVSTANYFVGQLDDDCTIDFTGWTTGKDSAITVELTEDGTGGWTPTFTGVTWLGGTTPTHDTTIASRTVYMFMSRDGGSTILGGQLGGGGSAATTMWVPVMTYDAGLANWLVAVTGGGDAIMTEVPI